ncbi:sensor histidine kinase [Engelhardtia mirabilis]|uniref:histidine kinase n=1 Tax=Engelhardtia mirabilis TaxID=2528011 RepID=A0A518BR76_9BACT|nr:Alkaline phosphatase synthesis sensor protein PhoR [Planctomycetes bacterium Pla133]QDV03776.1 Alkaline phosphatase synthesis sensor protein PhoR [Planctomycetes bacterium Pla86]
MPSFLADPVWRQAALAGMGAALLGILAAPLGSVAATIAVIVAGVVLANWLAAALEPIRAEVLSQGAARDPHPRRMNLRRLAAHLADSHEREAGVQADLRQERADLAALLRGTTDGILVLDGEQRAVLINEAAHRILGSPPDALGRKLQELVRSVELYELVDGLAVEGALPGPVRISLTRGDTRRSVRVTGARLVSPNGLRYLLVLHDMTDLQHLERIRTDFVTNVTHEMRSPLSAILGFAETLVDDAENLNEEVVDAAERIQRNARRLDDIVRDLVQLSRLEHAVAPEPQPTDLRALVAEIVARYQDAMLAKSQDLQVRLDDLPERLEVDPQLVRQALMNLVENAIKYTGDSGHITIAGEVTADRLRLSVADTGPGIPLEHQARIFERFYRVDTARSRLVGGTGLGLAIVKHSAALHGGSVHLESRMGRGSRFELVLPLPPEGSLGR